MEIGNVKSFVPLLHSIYRCHGNCERNILMSHLDEPSFNFVCNWMNKCINDPSILKLPARKLNILRKAIGPESKKIKYLTSKGGSIAKKRKIVKQSGEGIGLLLGILAPVLINLVKDLVTKASSKKAKKA